MLFGPRFAVTAVQFKANDETGIDWLGSDEVYAVFSDLNPNHYERVTSIYGDVDSGETWQFRDADRCIEPQPNCTGGVGAVHFKMALWESDGGFQHGDLPGTTIILDTGAATFDDLIGNADVSISRNTLLNWMPNVGDTHDMTIAPVGGDGGYTFTFRMTRLADGRNLPPIGPPVVVVSGISLQASQIASRVVQLTWSGTSGASVDLYRNNTKIQTVPNSGSFSDAVPSAGSYTYRVCNQNSTTCSPDVSVTVT